MSSESISLFLNPTAGRGRAGRRIERITALFAQAGIAVQVHASRAVGDLEQQVREYEALKHQSSVARAITP